MTKDFDALKNIHKIHMIGIGGVSMSGIALILKKDGFEVTGSDKNYGDMIDILENNGIPVFIGSNADLVKDADVVVYTSAINQHDPEFVRAKSLGIPTYERAKFLGLLLTSYKMPICICGTHGKTTTTSMVSLCFLEENLEIISQKEQLLTQRIVSGLSSLPNVILYKPTKKRFSTVCFNVKGISSSDVVSRLDEKGICVRGGIHCAILAHKTLQTVKTGAIRASLNFMNTEQEVYYFLDVIREMK